MSRTARIVGVVLLALNATACGVGVVGGVPETLSITPPPLTTPSPAAEAKYRSLPTCRQVAQKTPGLPPFRSGSEQPSASDMFTGCEFQRIPDWPRVNLDVSAWRDEAKARERFDSFSGPVDDGTADDVRVGEKAKWQTPKDNDSCYLIILDENAVLWLQYKPSYEPSPRSEECRGPLRELVRSFHAAVQPQ